MSDLESVVAVFDRHEQAEQAVKELQEGGLDMKTLSIAAKDTHLDEHVVGYYSVGDRMKYGGRSGRFGVASGVCSLDQRCLLFRVWVPSSLRVH